MQPLSGFIVVNKPTGETSFSIVKLLRRLTGVRRVGHAGTLDPLASGVLPVAIGHATRFIEYLDDEPKTYLASVRFGATSDTYDADGVLTPGRDPAGLTPDAVGAALRTFVGDIEQRPPIYSALKLAGKPLYRYAREGTDVPIAARRVWVERIQLLAYGGSEAEIEVRCGKGTYIRSLAHDLGQRLGCGAYLAGLVRIASSGFSIDQALTPAAIEALASAGRLEDALLAPDRALERRPAAILDGARTAALRTGKDLSFTGVSTASLCRAYDVSGEFVGVLAASAEGRWHPAKVIPAADRG